MIGFAAPWVLAAAAAIAVPLLAHLARHEDRAGQPFPSLMFLSRVPFPSRARRRLEDRALLALRVLALLALVLAFAGARLPRDASADAAGDTVVLLDLSYSMGLGDRFERAREAARAAIAEAAPDARVALLGFDGSTRTLSDLDAGRESALAALAAASPGPRGTDLGRALEGASQLLARSASPRRRVVLVSDLQIAGVETEPRLPEDVALEVRAVGGTPPANLALLGAWREAGVGAADAVLRARVANTGGAPGSAMLAVVVDGMQSSQHALALAPGEQRDLSVPVFAVEGRATRVHLQLDPDALRADDERFLVIASRRPLEVLVVRDPSRDDAWVEAALALARDPPLRVVVAASDRVTPAQVDAADVIVLDGTLPDEQAVRQALSARVTDGAGLLAFDGAGMSGAAGLADLLPTRGAQADAGAHGTAFGPLDPGHPLAQALGAARVAGLRVWRYRARAAEPGDAVVARYADGAPALVAREAGRGRILWFSTALDRRWSELAVDPVFVPLLIEGLAFVGRTAPAVTALAPGEVLDVGARIAASGDPALARAADGGAGLWLRSPSGTMRRAGRSDALRVDEPGFYELRADGASPVPVAVSVSTRESMLEAFSPDAFESRVRRHPRPATPPAAAEWPAAARDDPSLARALLVLAACLLLAEALLAARLSRARATREAGA